MNRPLVSVILLSYNNYSYIYEALDSVLNQDYPNIELIISDDGSSNFDRPAIEKYLSKNQKKNISHSVFIVNKKNLGTVKSVNNAIKKAQGEYILFFAADDAFYDQKGVSRFMDAFRKLPPREYIVTAQLGMYDIHLRKLIKLFISKSDIELLKKQDPQELFNQMANRCITAAASTCYRASLFKKYGYFDERYRLVEDWSSALRFSRLGLKFHYTDFVAFKHRDGGVSHGNIYGEKKLNKQYDSDLLNIMKHEVLPHLKLLSPSQKEKFMTFYKDHEWRFKYNYQFTNSSRTEKRLFVEKNWRLMLKGNYLDLKQYFIDQLEGKKLKLLIISLFFILIPGMPLSIIRIGWVGLHILLIITAYQLYKIFGPRLYDFLRFLI